MKDGRRPRAPSRSAGLLRLASKKGLERPLCALAALSVAAVVFALEPRAEASPPRAEARPYDAPRIDAVKRLPALPPEYLTHDEGWIHFAYHPSARERVRPLIADAEKVRAELAEALGVAVLASVEVRVAAVPAEMARLAPAELPSYAPAVALMDQSAVVMSVTSPLSLEPPDLGDQFRHELAHLALDDAAQGHPLPRWFHEGFATWAAGENVAARAQTLATASLRQRTIGLSELEPNLPADAPQASLAYAESADFVRFLRATSPSSFRSLIERLRGGETFDAALAAAYGADAASLERGWRRDLARRYSFLPVLLTGLVVWALGLGIAFFRRMRAKRRLTTPERRERREPTTVRPRALSARERLLRDPAIRIVASRGAKDELGETLSPDPEVPKIEHDGRWYTLH